MDGNTRGTQSLSNISKGQRAVVRFLNGGRLFCSRAANLGFTLGAELTVLQNCGSGPMMVVVRGTRVALGRVEAAWVMVEAQ